MEDLQTTIRLVAVDMDGTFLHHDDTYDRARFARLRTQMDAAGVRFVVASGNQYAQISSFFPYRDELSFVGDNGAYVVEQGTPLFAAQIEPAVVHAVVDLLDAHGVPYLASAPGRAYVPDAAPQHFYDTIARYYHSLQRIGSVHDVADRIFKFALHDERGLPDGLDALIADAAGAGVVPVTSGHGSMDLGAPGVHKASGLEILMDRWSIDWSQTATFGDSFNDLEMLKRARFSVAMANAAEELKQIARFTTDSNDADGVLNQLEQWFA